MNCVDDETLGAFVEGRLDAQRRREVMEHLDSCDACTVAAGLAAQTLGEESPAPARRTAPWWIAAAAVLAAAFAGAMLLRDRRPIAGLVAAAPSDHRPVEPRLSGGFPYAEYRGVVREGNARRSDPETLELFGAAGKAIESNDAHAAGVALLLIDDGERSIEKLRAAAERSANDARLWSDLAAAYYSVASRRGRASLYPQSLAAADRALSIDAQLPEALFNRALVLERMGLLAEARKAWGRYLEVDASSPWAKEARARVARLGTGEREFQRDLARLAPAELVAKYPQEARTWGEGPFLAAWAEGDRAKLDAARAIGSALAAKSGETLLRDAVAAIDRANAAQRAALIEGHLAYREGRIAYSRRELTKAAELLGRAAEALTRGASPMAAAARYFAANVRYDRNQPEEAFADLSRLLEANDPGHRALRAQILWQRALCSSTLAHWSESVADAEAARAIFEALGEETNRASVDAVLAAALEYTEEADRAWERRIATFAALSRAGANERLVPSLGEAVHAELRRGHAGAARALVDLEIETARRIANRSVLAVALLYRAMLLHRSGGGDPARDLTEARALAPSLGDAARIGAELDFAEGVVARRREPRRSIELLTRSADFFRASFPAFLPAALLERGRAHRDAQQLDRAWSDFVAGIEFVEARRDPRAASETEAAGLFDDEQQLFGGAVAVALQRGDAREAFAFADRALQHALRTRFPTSRGGPLPAAALPGEALLAIYESDGEVVLFCMTASDIRVARAGSADRIRADARALVDALASRKSVETIRQPAASLHRALIAPLRGSLAGARSLAIVADPRLGFIPFAALYDDRYLIEELELVVRPAAGMPLRDDGISPGSALVVADPANATVDRLAGASREAADVAASYRGAAILDGPAATSTAITRALASHRVFHYAGHAAAEERSAALLLADGRLYATDLARLDLRNLDLVVLAACRSSRGANGTIPRDLATAFFVAGARTVVGTGWEIDDEMSASFAQIHRAVAAGVRAPQAVRDAQLAALRAGRHPGGWAAITVLSAERS